MAGTRIKCRNEACHNHHAVMQSSHSPTCLEAALDPSRPRLLRPLPLSLLLRPRRRRMDAPQRLVPLSARCPPQPRRRLPTSFREPTRDRAPRRTRARSPSISSSRSLPPGSHRLRQCILPSSLITLPTRTRNPTATLPLTTRRPSNPTVSSLPPARSTGRHRARPWPAVLAAPCDPGLHRPRAPWCASVSGAASCR